MNLLKRILAKFRRWQKRRELHAFLEKNRKLRREKLEKLKARWNAPDPNQPDVNTLQNYYLGN
jgi:hypothetical protein